ncbi:carbohydrate kinase family protein [Streptomyces sp. RKAG293]|uniref:carbohydrate kinase family protein n=1 Tax=Streptomyces sp. RKAG293 TaxID=2893403 RepID=UPI0020347ECC|nr:carbohydrate kinase family protein [Streptomyces sp. RKAG293]MCM2422782.1 carbohydrate kinase family protein [Streptomyces sp. RKAG293]
MGRPDLLVVGDANPDVLVTGAPLTPPGGQAEILVDGAVLALGGSAAIVAHGAARLGMSTALAAMVGRDAAGDFVLDVLSSAGVDISGCLRHESLPTGLSVCLNRPGGDRAILTAPGCLPHFAPRTLPAARHVHAASYFLQPALAGRLPALFRAARAGGASTSLDTNYDPAGSWQLAPGLLGACDLVLPNAAEALALTGAGTVLGAMSALAGTGAVPVVKLGRRGAVVQDSAGPLLVSGTEVDPVDTVGAGDSFDAGFLAGWLDSGDLVAAAALGCACGALSTRAAGGTATQPGRPEAAGPAARAQAGARRIGAHDM